jgi:proteasome activator subunit 4
MTSLWQPWYPSVSAFLQACAEKPDPLHLQFVVTAAAGISSHLCIYREGSYLNRIEEITAKFPAWKEERLPPPRTSQSEVGLSADCRLPKLTYNYIVRQSRVDLYVLLLPSSFPLAENTLVLQCIWIAAHGQQATLMFPYAIIMLSVLESIRLQLLI